MEQVCGERKDTNEIFWVAIIKKKKTFIQYIEIPRTFVKRPASEQFQILPMILSVSYYPLYYSMGRIPVKFWEDMLSPFLGQLWNDSPSDWLWTMGLGGDIQKLGV